ncbi:hypothetical protein AUK10_02520 [Candidatus Gracilibacteria bacterium CG2_30_37_12]|nr:MAG: hypothetical protein AUK10_02520 [Candidatus Gracilibacteria bacterium CG2_30_37_12]
MNHTKITTSSCGFTLVELIVVITILVILGTIAFLNLGGMSATARDSQRTSDLNQISTQIMVAQAKQGIAYMTMLSGTTANTLTEVNNLGGAAINSGSYLGGDVNYTVLGIDSAKMSDPTSGGTIKYKMGATSIAGGSYELAAILEESQTALVMGTFTSRNAQATGTIVSIGANNTITLSNTDIGKFFVNDFVRNGTYTGTINKVVINGAAGVSLSLSTTPPTTTTGSLNLGAVDATGLIRGSGSINPVVNKGTNLPY